LSKSDKQKREQERLAEKKAAEAKALEQQRETMARLEIPVPADGINRVERQELVESLKSDGNPALAAVGARMSAEEVMAISAEGHEATRVKGDGAVAATAMEAAQHDLAEKSFEAGVYQGASAALAEQLEALLSRLRPAMKPGESPEEALKRVLLLAGTVTDILGTEHPHASLLVVAQTGDKPERYNVLLLEKLADGSLGTVKGAENEPWSEARDVASKLFHTRITPEQFRE
jgi:hypothetical protein